MEDVPKWKPKHKAMLWGEQYHMAAEPTTFSTCFNELQISQVINNTENTAWKISCTHTAHMSWSLSNSAYIPYLNQWGCGSFTESVHLHFLCSSEELLLFFSLLLWDMLNISKLSIFWNSYRFFWRGEMKIVSFKKTLFLVLGA